MVAGELQRRSRRLIAALLLLAIGLTLAAPARPATAQSDLRYFYETGHYIRGAFRQYWESNGGIAVYGLPVTEEYFRSDGRIVQWFQRARFELASSNPIVIELGRLGAEATGGRIFPQVPPFQSTAKVRYFPQTGHSLRGLFKDTWERRGAERVFGLPLSEEISEQINGQWTVVQYFERQRFELRLYPSRVEFGLLGAQRAPFQLLDPWPPDIAPPGPLNEDGTPRPPAGYRPGAERATVRLAYEGGGDQVFLVQGEGFQPGERVRFLTESPAGKITSLDPVPLADVNGSISYAQVRFATKGYANGRWYLTAQGQTSGRTAVAQLTIGGGGPPTGGGGTPPASGTRVAVVPGSGTFGQAFLVQGDGFDAREKVSFWLTGPDQTVRPINNRPNADANGSITSAEVRFTVDSTFRVGTWSLTAKGNASGRTAVAMFQIVAGGTPPPAGGGGGGGGDANRYNQVIHDGLGASNGGSIIPIGAPPEVTFTFNAGGFDAGERVGVWLTRPNGGGTVAVSSGITRDGGNLRVSFRVDKATEGTWAITAEGVKTKRNVTATFAVTRAFVGGPGTPRPPSRNGSVSPPEGGKGTAFRLMAQGFRAGEQLEFWITTPDGLYLLSGTQGTDSRGRIGVSPALEVRLSAQNLPGLYGYHYRGKTSGVRADLYFSYTGQ